MSVDNKTNKTRSRMGVALGAFAVIAAFGLGAPEPATAASKFVDFQVTATVAKTCSITATNMVFGTYDALGADVPQTSTVTVKCNKATAWSIDLDAGANLSGTQRRMKSASTGDFLNYGLFKEVGHSTNWGSGGSGTAVGGTGDGSDQPQTVFGLLPTGQTTVSAAADYADTIRATVNY